MTTSAMSYQEFEAATAYTAGMQDEYDVESAHGERGVQAYFIPSHGSIKSSSFRENFKHTVGSGIELVQDFTLEDFYSDHWADLNSTLLMNSGMRSLASQSLSRAATFAGTYLSKPVRNQAALNAFEELGRNAVMDNPSEIKRFLAKNRDILDLLHLTFYAARAHNDVLNLKVWVFTDPEDGSQSLYIGAKVKGNDFRTAYEAENAVFELALEKHSRLNNFRILLSFETEEDGRSE